MAKRKPYDVHWYKGPIERADGQRPYNGHLWPTESWWPAHDVKYVGMPDTFLGHGYHRLWFSYIALADGRYATDGCTWAIEKDLDCRGHHCVYSTRKEAMLRSAARMMHTARFSSWAWDGRRHMNHGEYIDLLNWTRIQIARALKKGAPTPAQVMPDIELQPVGVEAGLPLFNQETT